MSYFAILSAISLVVGGCTRQNDIGDAASDGEFAAALAGGFRRGDSDAIERLTHPDTPVDLADEATKVIAPFISFRREHVDFSLTTIDKVPIDLPGKIGGRSLQYASEIDGVVHLVSTTDDGSIELYFPFTRSQNRYFLPAIAYASENKPGQQVEDADAE